MKERKAPTHSKKKDWQRTAKAIRAEPMISGVTASLLEDTAQGSTPNL
jgi:hypothetical protein